MEIQEKDIEVVKTQVSKALQAAEAVEVDSDEQMIEAGEIRKRIKTVGEMIDEQKKSATDPLNKSLKVIRGWFKPIEDDYEQAKNIISKKMLAYQDMMFQEQERVREENEAKIKAREQEPEMKIKMTAVPQVVQKSEDFHTRTVKKFRVVDIAIVPREFMVVDEVAVRKQMMAGIPVCGIEYYSENILV